MSIPASRTKSKKALVLTLPAMAIEILRSVPRREGQQFVFGKAGVAGYTAWSYSLTALNARVTASTGQPLPPFTLHDLRRSMRSGLSKIGIQPHIAELCIGHNKKGIVAVYDRFGYEAEIKTALARWAEHIASIVEDRPDKVVPLRA